MQRAWRSLPRERRQAAFAALTQFGIRRRHWVEFNAKLNEPVIVVGPLAAPTGIGQAARLALHALHETGISYGAIDLSSRLMQPSTESFPEGAVAEGKGTLLLYVTPPNCGYALRAIPRSIRKNKTIVAGWVCETTRLPAMWRRQARLFDIVAAPSRFAAQAIEASIGRPVRVIGHPVTSEPLLKWRMRKEQRTPHVVGAVLDVGSSGDRKNVHALITCIETILNRSKDIVFHLKVRDLRSDAVAAFSFEQLRAKSPERIYLVQGDDSREETLAFLDRLDLLVSLSRAEGFALPYAEAIMRGVRVAAPRWGGPAEYLTDQNSIALPFSLVPIQDRVGLYGSSMGEWAEIDPLAAANLVMTYLMHPRPVETSLPPLCTGTFFIRSLSLKDATPDL